MTRFRRHLAHWLRTLATRIDPDRVDAFEHALREVDMHLGRR